jgi:hypothetical protein
VQAAGAFLRRNYDICKTAAPFLGSNDKAAYSADGVFWTASGDTGLDGSITAIAYGGAGASSPLGMKHDIVNNESKFNRKADFIWAR